MKQPYGVMVAQMILVHLVGVRISVGLPFFCPDGAKKSEDASLLFTARSATSLKRRKPFLHIFTKKQRLACEVAPIGRL